jgi:hypothetical protein
MATEANNWKMFWLIGIITGLVGLNLYIYSNVFKEAKKETTERINQRPHQKKVKCSADSCSYHPKWLKDYKEQHPEGEEQQPKAKDENPNASMLLATQKKKRQSPSVWDNDNSPSSNFKRKIVKKAKEDIRKLNREKGKIYCRLAIDRQGNVIACKYVKERSTIEKEQLGKAIAAYLKQFKFEANSEAPEVEYTGYSVTFK